MAIRKAFVVSAFVVLVAFLGGYLLTGANSYNLRLVMPSAAQLLDGSPVWINGKKAGTVSHVDVKDGKAVVTASISDEMAPLHDGTTTKVEWNTVLGERVVTIVPGPEQNAVIPSGALYEAQTSQVEIDQVLSALDTPTRERVNSLLAGLRGTVQGREPDIQASLRTAGPALDALGEVLAAVGRDGPAIRQLASSVHNLMQPIAARQDQVRSTVDSLTTFTGNLARQQSQLRAGLDELPPTLDTVKATLDKVPAASKSATGLLEDLKPGMDRLPGVAENLSPVMKDLKPVSAQLRPTFGALAELLRYTPDFIDVGHDALPSTAHLLDQLGPAVEFLRPYTPEFIGTFQNWAQDSAGYDSQGHVWGVNLSQVGPMTLNEQSNQLPPVMKVDPKPAPGAAVGQPWTDANGNGMR